MHTRAETTRQRPAGTTQRGQAVVAKSATLVHQERPFKNDSQIILNGQVLHSISDYRLELVKSMEDHMTNQARLDALLHEKDGYGRV